MRVKKKTHRLPDMNSEALKEFRQAAYNLLVKAKDATFELMDAVMTTRHAACLAEFALSPLFNRQWSSVYEALQDRRARAKETDGAVHQATGATSPSRRICIGSNRPYRLG